MTAPALQSSAASGFLALGHYDAHIARLREALKGRRAVLEAALKENGVQIAGAPVAGGSSVWIEGRAGIDAAELATALRNDSVLIEPGAVFFETPPEPCPFFRLGYGSIDADRIALGIELIATAADRLWQCN